MILGVKTMVRFVSLLILSGLQIGSVDPYANARALLLQRAGRGVTNPDSRGCACHCDTDTATFRVWHQKDGPPDRFAARTIGRWFNRLKSNTDALSKTELLILLGRSAKGIWSLETQETDAGAEIHTDLVCVTVGGRRKVFPVINGLFISDVNESALSSRVLRRLRQLAKSGSWDVDLLIPPQLPLLSKPPALVFREQGKPDDEKSSYSWSLSIRGKNGRLVRITGERGPAGSVVQYFRAAKCFGGVRDDANAVTWWIMVKTAAVDNCSTSWYSIRLPHNVL